MRTKQGNTLESLRSVQAFLDANAVALQSVVNTGARQRLDDAIAQLDRHAGQQTGSALSAKGATQKHIALRESLLRDHMAPIARIAVAEIPMTPDVEPLRIPRRYLTPERLRAAAVGMAEAAAPYSSIFVDAGLPPDFIERLNAAADATTDAIGERRQNRVVGGGATKGLAVTLSAGRKIVHILDAFVKTAAKHDPALLASWSIAKRVGRLPGPRGATRATGEPEQLSHTAHSAPLALSVAA